jgi:hypothetical protein
VGIVNAMYAEARAGNPAGDLFSRAISVALLAHVYDRYDRSRRQTHKGDSFGFEDVIQALGRGLDEHAPL